MSLDHYAVLEVEQDASAETIKASYRKLIRQHHPDLVGGGEETSARINAAFDELGNAERRVAYDRSLAEEFDVEAETEAEAEAEEWGVTDDSWTGVAHDSFIEPSREIASRIRLWNLGGWALLAIGGAAATTPWTLGGVLAPPSEAAIVPLVLILAVLAATGLRGRNAANRLWRAAIETKITTGGWAARLAMRLGLLVFVAAVWALLSSMGTLAAFAVAAFGLAGGFTELGFLASSGLIACTAGGLVARYARLRRDSQA